MLALAPATASAGEVAPHGAVVVRWQSNPQTCADYGLCDRAGSLSWRPRALAAAYETFGQGRALDVDFVEGRAIARSARSTPAGTRVCVDAVDGPVSMEGLAARGARRARLSLGEPPGLDFGRCAGPLPADFAAALPRSASFDPAAIARKGGVIDMRSRTPFAAGPFQGEVVSSLRLRLTRTTNAAQPARSARASRIRRAPLGTLAIDYAIDGVTGEARLPFSGAADAMCEVFDACGLSGTITLGGTDVAGHLRIQSARTLRRGQRETVAGALDALRSRRTTRVAAQSFFGDEEDAPEPVEGVFAVRESAGFPGEQPCSDHSELHTTNLGVSPEQSGIHVVLGGSGGEPPDELRTRCPGPAGVDLPARLVEGTLPLSSVGEQSPPLALRPPAAFWSPAFTGSAGSGQLDVRLCLIGMQVETF